MKKSIILMSAVTLALASCSNEEMHDLAQGSDGLVTFSASIPSSLLSRAYGDGSQLKNLHYAVYETGSDDVVFASDVTGSPTPVTIDATNFTLPLNLVKGKSYDFIFWADATTGSPYTFSSATKSVTTTYDTPVNANDENRDAFFQSIANLTVTGPMNQPVELRRPFAQLNIGTSDLKAVEAAKSEVASVSVTVSDVYGTLNLLSGVASDPQSLTFTGVKPENETFPVDGYDYLSMNYLLTGNQPEADNVQQAQRELTDATIVITLTDNHSTTVTVPNLPLQRNYRTNVYGALLTSPLDFTITVNPEFYTPGNDVDVLVAQFLADMKDPAVTTVQVPANLDLTKVTQEDLTFDHNKTIEVSNNATITLPHDACFIANNGLTISGKGTLACEVTPNTAEETEEGNTFRQLVRVMGGDLVIDGVTLDNDLTYHNHGNASKGYPLNSAAVSYYNDANVTINNATIYSGEYTVCGMGRDVASGTVTITNSYFESNSSNSNGTWSYNMRIFGKEATLENCTVIGTQGGVSADSKELVMTIKSGTYTTVNTPGKTDAHYPVYATNGATVIIEGGKFAGANVHSNLAEGKAALVAGDNDVNLPDGQIQVFGGVFSGLPYNHSLNKAIAAPQGYEFVLNEEADKDPYKWTVRKTAATTR